MDIIVSKLGIGSHLIVSLTCKEMYKILKTFNDNKKLNGTLKYLTSTLSLLKYGHKNGCPWQVKTCNFAAGGGHLECLKYAHENGCGWSHWTCECAARNGHLECLKYALENDCPWYNTPLRVLLKRDIYNV
jgi:hypothetical protein